MTLPIIYTLRETAAFLKVCDKTLRKEIRAGRLGVVFVGSRMRVTEEDLRADLERQTVSIRAAPQPMSFTAVQAQRYAAKGRTT